MAWIKVPPQNHPIFYDALPKSPSVETLKMFGGVAAKVNGHLFAGLFGRSTMVLLAEPDRAEALRLEGATPFDPMGDGRVRSDKVMLPESMMGDEEELRSWIARAYKTAAALPRKAVKKIEKAPAGKRQAATNVKAKRSPTRS
jgi:TfoX/Sxy family transcriptional regulator of competence genes